MKHEIGLRLIVECSLEVIEDFFSSIGLDYEIGDGPIPNYSTVNHSIEVRK